MDTFLLVIFQVSRFPFFFNDCLFIFLDELVFIKNELLLNYILQQTVDKPQIYRILPPHVRNTLETILICMKERFCPEELQNMMRITFFWALKSLHTID